MNEKILVVGATGNIGHHLVELLVKKGKQVKAASLPQDPYPQQNNVEVVSIDLYKPETFDSALKGVDKVFAICLPKELDSDKNINPLVDRAKAAGVTHFVLVTSMGTEHAGEELGYRRAELYLIASGLDYTILRPGWFMQMMLAEFLLSDIKESGRILMPGGDGKTAFLDARDIAAVAAQALTADGHKGKEYTLTGDKAINFNKVAQIISKAASRPIEYVEISDDDLRKTVIEKGGYPGPIEFVDVIFKFFRTGDFAHVDPTLYRLLGRNPISFEQFAMDHVNFWQAH